MSTRKKGNRAKQGSARLRKGAAIAANRNIREGGRQEPARSRKKPIAIAAGGVLLLALLVWGLVFPNGFMFGLFIPPVVEGDISRAEFSYYYYLVCAGLSENTGGESVTGEDTRWMEDEHGDEIVEMAKEELKKNTFLSQQAQAAGVILSERWQAQVQENLEIMRQQAEEAEVTLDYVLSEKFGVGMSEGAYIKIMERAYLARQWATERMGKYQISDADAQSYYEQHRDDIDVVDYYCVYFVAETESEEPSASEEAAAFAIAQTKAEVFDAKISQGVTIEELAPEFPTIYGEEQTLEAAFKTDRPIVTFAQQDVRDWMASPDRKPGDHAAFVAEDQSNVSVISIAARRRPEEQPVSFRHVLIFSELEGEDPEVTRPMAKTYTEELYEKWKAGGGSEETFAQMAYEESGDKESRDNGGLFADADYSMVQKGKIADWVFDAQRIPGDSTVIELPEGHHILYFVSRNDLPSWRYQVNTSLVNERFQSDLKRELDSFALEMSYIELRYVLPRQKL